MPSFRKQLNPAQVAPSSTKPQKRGFLDMIGVKTEVKKTDAELVHEEHLKTCEQGYWYLRQMIDRAIMHYYRTRDLDRRFEKIEEFVERPALDALKEKLEDLRRREILWVQPSRVRPDITVIPDSLVLKGGYPVRYVVEERMTDNSQYNYFADGQLDRTEQCPGRERVIRVTVDVIDRQEYKLRSVVVVQRPR